MEDLDRDDINYLLSLTDRYVEVNRRRIPRSPALRGKTVALAFYEDSTRTRLSFMTAASRLSADTVAVDTKRSSVNKGESLRDTIETISAMGIHGIVVRHSGSGAPWRVREWTDAAVINAGDGINEHPTQALTDLYTARTHFGDLNNKRIAIIGDIKNSRVARSNALGFSKMGAEVVFVAPKTLLPLSLEGWPVSYSHDLDEVIDNIDICYLLRVQLERNAAAAIPTLREYHHEYGLTSARADRLADGAVIMHPGPLNRDIEITSEVAQRPNSLVTKQVTNGVAVRMAVLFALVGSRLDLVDSESAVA